MPTIVDSLFLELGIDTSKFSKDQASALSKIQRFESETKRAADGARSGIKSVGAAFKDLADESRIGASSRSVENLASKFKNLGMSMSLSGGATGAAGAMALGLGRLLSPVGLGIAAVGLLGKEMWSLNRQMTDANASIFRQSQLSDMNAKSLWGWGEAAKTVGANPQDVTGGISSLQTAIAGMGIGAADATPQLIALSRLGLGYNFQSGMTDDQVGQMFEKVHQQAAKRGYKNLGALRALTSPIMNDAMFNIATDQDYDPAKLKQWIDAQSPKNLGKTLKDSLHSQTVLGKLGIEKDVLAETAYGGEQGLLQAVVTILTSLLGEVVKITDFMIHPIEGAKNLWNRASSAVSSFLMRPLETRAMNQLMAGGMSKEDAAAIVGNLAQESSMNPLARNAGHVGIGQWDSQRQAEFAKRFGYQMGSGEVDPNQQLHDQVAFVQQELSSSQRAAAVAMAKSRDVAGKTRAFMDMYERPGDNSLSQRMGFATDAAGLVSASTRSGASVHHNVSSETNVQNVIINTPSTDPQAHAEAFRKGIQNPLGTPDSQSVVSLSTRAATG